MRIYPQRSAAAAAAFLNRERTSRVWQRCELPCYLPRSPERSRRTRCRRRVRQGRSSAAAALNKEIVVPALMLLINTSAQYRYCTVFITISQSVSQSIISRPRPALTPPPAPPLPFDHKYQSVSQLLTQVGEWSTIFHVYKAPTLQYTCLGIEWLFHGPARAHPSAGSPFTTSGPPSTRGNRHGGRYRMGGGMADRPTQPGATPSWLQHQRPGRAGPNRQRGRRTRLPRRRPHTCKTNTHTSRPSLAHRITVDHRYRVP